MSRPLSGMSTNRFCPDRVDAAAEHGGLMPLESAILSDGHAANECPRWHDGELYFSDMYAGRVYAVTEEGERRLVAEIPGRPAGLGWLPDGTLLVVSQHDRVVYGVDADG